MTETEALFNPFPGLRPFEPDEDHLFFGREEEVDELLRRLRSNRFLAIVGTSGCGKSSLVRSGLIPSLHSGFMAKAGSSWRVAILRPGEDPIGRLATALDAPHMIGAPTEELVSTNRVLIDAALRRGTLGLVEAVRHARVPPGDNLLIVVDQFEEVFRFRTKGAIERSRDEATAFVKLLLEAAGQQGIPIYVVLTMRADFIGDCVEYQGLPEALNASQYLVPRLTRDELRAAIMGPIAVAGGKIAPRLVVRLLNDIGSDHDQLPVLQHVLMRTWDHWQRHGGPDELIDIGHYEAVGTLKDALSRHAEEAFRDVGSPDAEGATERIFKAMTDTVTDPRGTRRPCQVSALAAIANVTEAEVARIVDLFRQPGRSFLMPPADVPLGSNVIVDISHESLMRCWTRLISWTEEERASASVYLRLSRAAAWFDEGSAGLWRDPELELGLRWQQENRPSQAWARRYDDSFDRAMRFLARSAQERERENAERAAMRQRQWRWLQATAAVFFVALVYTVWSYVAVRTSRKLAEDNLESAVRAVDLSLALVDRDPTQLGMDHAEVIAIRRDLAERARLFYEEFIARGGADEKLRQSVATTHFKLGNANRVLGNLEAAAREYTNAIAQLEGLSATYAANPKYRQDLANSYTFLGETLRLSKDRYAEARKAYDTAASLQQQLIGEHPDAPDVVSYRQDLARTYYNRGILHSEAFYRLHDQGRPADAEFRLAESDFRDSIAMLEPIARTPGQAGAQDAQASQGLSRALNNLGSLLAEDRNRHPLTEVEGLHAQAVQIHTELVAGAPNNREYKLELAKFYNNLSGIQSERGLPDRAGYSNERALALLDELARPAPSLGVDLADVHTLRGHLLEGRDAAAALAEYGEALKIFERLDRDPQAPRASEYHLRFGELLDSLAVLVRLYPDDVSAREVLSRAAGHYLSIGARVAQSGTPAEAQSILDNMSRLMPELPNRDRTAVVESYQELELKLRQRAASKVEG